VITIATERLLLEPWLECRREAFKAIARDPEVIRYIASGEIWEAGKADGVFDRMLAHWSEHGFGWRSAIEKESGDWLGFVGLNRVGPEVEGVDPDEIEIGWWVVRSVWSRGYATEAALAVRDEGFGPLGLGRMSARLQAANLASARVAEKIGMRFERTATGRSGESVHVYALVAGPALAKPDHPHGRRAG
jgi:RimJ/RimL family protein N-acetyltransferase